MALPALPAILSGLGAKAATAGAAKGGLASGISKFITNAGGGIKNLFSGLFQQLGDPSSDLFGQIVKSQGGSKDIDYSGILASFNNSGTPEPTSGGGLSSVSQKTWLIIGVGIAALSTVLLIYNTFRK